MNTEPITIDLPAVFVDAFQDSANWTAASDELRAAFADGVPVGYDLRLTLPMEHASACIDTLDSAARWFAGTMVAESDQQAARLVEDRCEIVASNLDEPRNFAVTYVIPEDGPHTRGTVARVIPADMDGRPLKSYVATLLATQRFGRPQDADKVDVRTYALKGGGWE